MRRAFIAICALIAASSFAPAQSQTLYAFLVVDTKAGKAYRANLGLVKALVAEITNEKFMPVIPVEVTGNLFNCRTIAARLNTYRITRNDAVLFYYSGQGFQTAGAFPEFDCRRSWKDRNRVELAGVVAHFTKRKEKPRLVVAIADTHNKKLSRRPDFFAMRVDDATAAKARRKQLLAKLFRDSGGVFTITAAKKGEDAYFMTQGDVAMGGYFTNQFLDALERFGSPSLSGDPTWEAVLAWAARRIPLYEEPPVQTPYLETLKLKGNSRTN